MEKHQLTPVEVEYLKGRGEDPAAIEGAVVHMYSFEDWLDLARDIGPFRRGEHEIWADYLSETGGSTTKEEGVLTVFILREAEARKIERHKSKIIERFVKAYADILNQHFLARWKGSKEKNLLVDKELQQLDKLLMQWKEATVYFSYTHEQVLRFQTYGGEKRRTMCEWYERICIDGEDAKTFVSREHSNWSAKQLSEYDGPSSHRDLHFVVAALAFHRFKEDLEAYRVTKLTFQSWKNGEWPEKALGVEGAFVRPYDGKQYSLSEEEYQKVATARTDIFENRVALFLQGQIDGFEQRFTTSLERDSLIGYELQRINTLLTDEGLLGGHAFPNPKGATTWLGILSELPQGENKKANPFPYWYNQLIVQGKDACPYIHPMEFNLTFPVAVHVLYRYKQFLENRLTGNEAAPSTLTEQKNSKLKDKARLNELIASGHIEKALEELFQEGIGDAALLLSRYNRAKKERHANTIGFEEHDRVQSQITEAARDLIEKGIGPIC